MVHLDIAKSILGWLETHPDSQLVWDYLRSPAQNCSLFAGYLLGFA